MQTLPNIRHLAALYAVMQRGSFSAAAQAVHLTQPAVTQAVALLERHFASRLFVRLSRGVELTEAGAICAPRIGRAFDRIREGLRGFAGARSSEAQLLRGITSVQLEALTAVVDAGGFSAAARGAGRARTTYFRSARALEARLASGLFESTSHGIRPTREAGRLARQVLLAKAELAQARAEIAALNGSDRGSTVVGAMPLARSAVLPQAILRFSALKPQHSVSILEGPYDTLLEALQSGAADVLIGALRGVVPGDVLEEHLFDDPLAIIARAGHPLAATRSVRAQGSLPDLRRYPWIAPRRESPLRRQFERLFEGTPSAPVAPIECNSLETARAILVSSDRLMLLSAQQVHAELVSGQLIALPHPLGRVMRAIGLTLRRDWHPTTTQRELIEALRQQARLIGLRDASHPGSPARRRRGRRAVDKPI
jgi:LysR family transcriptional regulator of gallate degradation